MAGLAPGSEQASQPAGYDGLVAASASIGADPLLVQGGGGNSSLKTDDLMLVKASGFWLRDVRERNMFVPVDLAGARRLAKAGAEKFDAVVRRDLDGGDLRPSIETGLHALMPHRYVLHAHPVNAIAATVSSERGRLAARLAGLSWTLIEYATPGPSLGLAFDRALTAGSFDVVLLANHGAVAGGSSGAEAEERLREVERRLAAPRASVAVAPPPASPAPDGYRWFDDHVANGLALDVARVTTLTHGALVPDQVVYLGGPAVLVERTTEVASVAQRWKAERGCAPGLVFVAGEGALVRADLTAGGLSMIGLLCEIALRLPAGETPATLSLTDELGLLNWEAEKYRQGVDRSRG
jgi:rhamnose utilization protein RhaD (predicted bifunctional aldolase and dehydrogenase)